MAWIMKCQGNPASQLIQEHKWSCLTHDSWAAHFQKTKFESFFQIWSLLNSMKHTLHLLGKGRIWGFCRRDETWATQKYASACSVAHDFSIQPLWVSNFICMGESYHVLCCTDLERISEASWYWGFSPGSTFDASFAMEIDLMMLWEHVSLLLESIVAPIFVHWWLMESVKGETISAYTKCQRLCTKHRYTCCWGRKGFWGGAKITDGQDSILCQSQQQLILNCQWGWVSLQSWCAKIGGERG